MMEMADLVPCDLTEEKQNVDQSSKICFSSTFDEILYVMIVRPLELYERKLLKSMNFVGVNSSQNITQVILKYVLQ